VDGDDMRIGCIADDFTGASDWASFFAAGGARVMLFTRVEDTQPIPRDIDAAVVAGKFRSIPPSQAVEQTEKTAAWLIDNGFRQLYYKYCSTFDSMPTGNIGPVSDALLRIQGCGYTVLCPALPVNGRTVKNGRLFVHGTPLDESPMKDHPLNPMWSSEIPMLMEKQSPHPCIVVSEERLSASRAQMEAFLARLSTQYSQFYLVPDCENDSHAEKILEHFGDSQLLTGGSGLAAPLGRRAASHSGTKESRLFPASKPGVLLLAGSCSPATLEQIAAYRETGGFSVQVDPQKLMSGEQTAESLWQQVSPRVWKGSLVYSSSAEAASRLQADKDNGAAKCIENAFACLARIARDHGVARIIVAGGETSGAVTQALGYSIYHIGESVAPGVPVLIPASHPQSRLVLKSGNFGQPDFFREAVRLTAR